MHPHQSPRNTHTHTHTSISSCIGHTPLLLPIQNGNFPIKHQLCVCLVSFYIIIQLQSVGAPKQVAFDTHICVLFIRNDFFFCLIQTIKLTWQTLNMIYRMLTVLKQFNVNGMNVNDNISTQVESIFIPFVARRSTFSSKTILCASFSFFHFVHATWVSSTCYTCISQTVYALTILLWLYSK